MQIKCHHCNTRLDHFVHIGEATSVIGGSSVGNPDWEYAKYNGWTLDQYGRMFCPKEECFTHCQNNVYLWQDIPNTGFEEANTGGSWDPVKKVRTPASYEIIQGQ